MGTPGTGVKLSVSESFNLVDAAAEMFEIRASPSLPATPSPSIRALAKLALIADLAPAPVLGTGPVLRRPVASPAPSTTPASRDGRTADLSKPVKILVPCRRF